MKNKIAFDLDGVISDTYSVYRLEFIKLYNIDIAKHPKYKITTYKIFLPNVSDKDISYTIFKVITQYWEEIHPYPDAVEALNLFYNYYKKPIEIVTARKYSRQEEVCDATYAWLNKNFPNIKFNVCFAGHDEKTKFLKENKFNIFVEDRLRNANRISNQIDKVYLINRMWNLGRRENDNVERVKSLKEAIGKIVK